MKTQMTYEKQEAITNVCEQIFTEIVTERKCKTQENTERRIETEPF